MKKEEKTLLRLKQGRTVSLILGLGCLISFFARAYLAGSQFIISDTELLALSGGTVVFFLIAYVYHLKMRIADLSSRRPEPNAGINSESLRSSP